MCEGKVRVDDGTCPLANAGLRCSGTPSWPARNRAGTSGCCGILDFGRGSCSLATRPAREVTPLQLSRATDASSCSSAGGFRRSRNAATVATAAPATLATVADLADQEADTSSGAASIGSVELVPGGGDGALGVVLSRTALKRLRAPPAPMARSRDCHTEESSAETLRKRDVCPKWSSLTIVGGGSRTAVNPAACASAGFPATLRARVAAMTVCVS